MIWLFAEVESRDRLGAASEVPRWLNWLQRAGKAPRTFHQRLKRESAGDSLGQAVVRTVRFPSGRADRVPGPNDLYDEVVLP